MKILKKECFSITETRVFEVDDKIITELNLYLHEQVMRNQVVPDMTYTDLEDYINDNATERLNTKFDFYVKQFSDETDYHSIHEEICKYLHSKFVFITPEKDYTPVETLECYIIK